MKTVRQVLVDARALIAKGWCQHTSHRNRQNEPTQFCTLGAIYTAAGEAVVVPFQARKAASLFEKHVPDQAGLRSVSAWNDRPERTQQQVLDKFDEVIASIGEEHEDRS